MIWVPVFAIGFLSGIAAMRITAVVLRRVTSRPRKELPLPKQETTKLGDIVTGIGETLSKRGIEDVIVGHPLTVVMEIPDEFGGSRYVLTVRRRPTQVEVH